MNLMRPDGRRFDRLARLVEMDKKSQNKCGDGQNQDQNQRHLELTTRSLRIICPNEPSVRYLIEIIGDRHPKLPRCTHSRRSDDMSTNFTCLCASAHESIAALLMTHSILRSGKSLL